MNSYIFVLEMVMRLRRPFILWVSLWFGLCGGSFILSEDSQKSSFYKKHVDADGIPIVSSENVEDIALQNAKKIVLEMLSRLPDVKKNMMKYKFKVAVVAHNEGITELPEYQKYYGSWRQGWKSRMKTDKIYEKFTKHLSDKQYMNSRGRGFGATLYVPVTSCAEENLMLPKWGKYQRMNLLVHEFAHSIHTIIKFSNSPYGARIREAYNTARKSGKWENTYAGENNTEYFAVGTQIWFDCVNKRTGPLGAKNPIHDRQGLKQYDPELYKILSEIYNHKTDPEVQKLISQVTKLNKILPHERKVNRKIKDFSKVTGRYQFYPNYYIDIFKEGDQLYCQLTYQKKTPIFPEQEFYYFCQDIDVQFIFFPRGKVRKPYMIMHHTGTNYRADKILLN